MRMILVAAVLCGCGGAPDLESALDDMPTVTLEHGQDAMRIVEREFGMPNDAASVRWVVGVMPQTADGGTIDGAAIACDAWVSWFGASWTSGASTDGPAISFTAFAHEMAHCALWLRGDADATHASADWWSPGGRVEAANAALADAGL